MDRIEQPLPRLYQVRELVEGMDHSGRLDKSGGHACGSQLVCIESRLIEQRIALGRQDDRLRHVCGYRMEQGRGEGIAGAFAVMDVGGDEPVEKLPVEIVALSITDERRLARGQVQPRAMQDRQPE